MNPHKYFSWFLTLILLQPEPRSVGLLISTSEHQRFCLTSFLPGFFENQLPTASNSRELQVCDEATLELLSLARWKPFSLIANTIFETDQLQDEGEGERGVLSVVAPQPEQQDHLAYWILQQRLQFTAVF